MWQLEYANDLFIETRGTLGKSEICYDVDAEIWEYNSDVSDDADEDQYCSDDHGFSQGDSDSDLEAFTIEDT
jgi:hypothetical protein